jgi:HEAT repeat protein
MTTDDKYGPSKTFDAMNTRGLSAKREQVRELELRADDDAIQRLLDCLRDESWFLRDLAEQALTRLGRRGADALVPLLRQGLWYTRAGASRILGRIGYGDAVPSLFELTQDSNHSVGSAALDALLEIGRQRGAIRLAHALHRMPPDARQQRMDEIQARDALLGERLRRLMRSDELMSVDDVRALDDDSAAVRASEEGVVWEVLTGPPPRPPVDGGDG